MRGVSERAFYSANISSMCLQFLIQYLFSNIKQISFFFFSYIIFQHFVWVHSKDTSSCPFFKKPKPSRSAYTESTTCNLKTIISTILKYPIFDHRSSHCAERFYHRFLRSGSFISRKLPINLSARNCLQLSPENNRQPLFFFLFLVSLLFWSLSLPTSIHSPIDYLGIQVLKWMHVISFGAHIFPFLSSLCFPVKEILVMASHSESIGIGQYLCSGQCETVTSWIFDSWTV